MQIQISAFNLLDCYPILGKSGESIESGEWITDDLSYYVKNYRIGLPEEFLVDVRKGFIEPIVKEGFVERLPKDLP